MQNDWEQVLPYNCARGTQRRDTPDYFPPNWVLMAFASVPGNPEPNRAKR